MLETINIFGFEYPMYSLLIIVGLAIALLFIIKYFIKFTKVEKQDAFFALLYGIIGMIIGGKVLFILTILPDLIQNYSNYTFMGLMQGGFVFYGGLIGGIAGVFVYAKQFKLDFYSLAISLVPAVPLVHAFGRIGCLCAGCCWGREYHGIGSITFTNSSVAPNNIPLFPVQLVESFCNLAIFVVLLVTFKKYVGTYKTIILYMFLYGITRFTLEFFRGDLIRGIWFGLSTSQWISIAMIAIGIVLIIKDKKRLKN